MPHRQRPNILLTSFYERPVIAEGLERLATLGEVREVNRGRNLTRQELLECLPGADACIAADEKYDAALLDTADKLTLIAREGTGYDGIDVQAATDRGILVTNAPAVHEATANLTIGLLIALVRRILVCDRGVREDLWTRRDHWLCPDVTGLTLGILGFGQVGRAVARRAVAMGMKVLVYNRSDVTAAAADLGAAVSSLDDVLTDSDVVSLHIRHSRETDGMFDARLFAKMKKGAYFINTARGGMVDESALLDALTSGRLTGAAVDVLAQEPPDTGHPLLVMDNVICTPHVAGETTTSMREAFDLAVEQVFDCFEGRKPQHLVNPEAWDKARIRAL